MTTVQIDLPDQLAKDAERAGLLSAEALEDLLRRQLRAKSAAALMAALSQMDSSDDSEAITPEVAAEEIALMRAERRTASKA
jgi:hypothetical protein